MLNMIINIILISNLFALLLILLRNDRMDFFNLFIKDFKEKEYLQVSLLLCFCLVGLWITIPHSINHLFANKNK